MILNIPALQYSLFGNIQKKLIENGRLKPGENLQVFPTVCPSPKFFEDLGVQNPIQYVKFISSAFRIDIGLFVFYFFFRNKKADNLGYVYPSSVEVICLDRNTKLKFNVMKYHYFGTEPDSILKMYDEPDFSEKSLMLSAVSVLSSTLADNFVKFVK